jgi:hypothetical protein
MQCCMFSFLTTNLWVCLCVGASVFFCNIVQNRFEKLTALMVDYIKEKITKISSIMQMLIIENIFLRNITPLSTVHFFDNADFGHFLKF